MVEVMLIYAMDLLGRIYPFLTGGLFALLGFWLMRRGVRPLDGIGRSALGDGLLIGTAIEEIEGDKPKETYLRVSILMELERLTRVYHKSDRIRFILGSVYLITGFISIAVTGTNLSIPGVIDTVKLSFAINIVGEMASGFLIFGGFEAKSAESYQLARLIRLELSQFIGQSAEYYKQSAETRWYLLTQTIEKLLLASIAPTNKEKREQKKEEASEDESSPMS